MKKIILLATLWVCFAASAQSCNDIKDKDKAHDCRANISNDKSHCQKIGNNDLLNLCMGKIEKDMKYCRRIATEKIKKRCENSMR
jgi:hypothetical protein